MAKILSLLACVYLFGTTGAQSSLADPLVVKGAWSSSSDASTPLPEGGTMAGNLYSSDYFGFAFQVPGEWAEKYQGPPPSERGYYVLAQIEPADAAQTSGRGHVLIAALDMFFTTVPAANALDYINFYKEHLGADYQVEQKPTEVRIANRRFVRLDYTAPAAQLHWHVLATVIRCHVVEFVFTGRNTRAMERLIAAMNTMRLPAGAPAGAGDANIPLCIPDFATAENVIDRRDPIFSEARFNPVPVRIIIDKAGRVKHIHFLSAFPDQAKSITDALLSWRFKPFLSAGQPVEVETGIIFGRVARAMPSVQR